MEWSEGGKWDNYNSISIDIFKNTYTGTSPLCPSNFSIHPPSLSLPGTVSAKTDLYPRPPVRLLHNLSKFESN